MSAALRSSLTLAAVTMLRACAAYLSVLSVSSTLLPAGLTAATMAVFEFPLRLSFSSLGGEEQRPDTPGARGAQRTLRRRVTRRPPLRHHLGGFWDLQLGLGLRALYFLSRFLFSFVKQ